MSKMGFNTDFLMLLSRTYISSAQGAASYQIPSYLRVINTNVPSVTFNLTVDTENGKHTEELAYLPLILAEDYLHSNFNCADASLQFALLTNMSSDTSRSSFAVD